MKYPCRARPLQDGRVGLYKPRFIIRGLAMTIRSLALPALALAFFSTAALGQDAPYATPYLVKSDRAVVLHAARLLDVAAGKIVSPGEILVQGDKHQRGRRIRASIRRAPK